MVLTDSIWLSCLASTSKPTDRCISRPNSARQKELKRRKRREMETIGTHWKQNGEFVANCFHYFLPQPATVREEACIVEVYRKPLKNPARHHTRLFARAPAPLALKT